MANYHGVILISTYSSSQQTISFGEPQPTQARTCSIKGMVYIRARFNHYYVFDEDEGGKCVALRRNDDSGERFESCIDISGVNW